MSDQLVAYPYNTRIWWTEVFLTLFKVHHVVQLSILIGIIFSSLSLDVDRLEIAIPLPAHKTTRALNIINKISTITKPSINLNFQGFLTRLESMHANASTISQFNHVIYNTHITCHIHQLNKSLCILMLSCGSCTCLSCHTRQTIIVHAT